jgi:hypothetical protein
LIVLHHKLNYIASLATLSESQLDTLLHRYTVRGSKS